MGFSGPMPMLILGSRKISIPNISADILYIIFECGYQIPVLKIGNEGRISNKI